MGISQSSGLVQLTAAESPASATKIVFVSGYAENAVLHDGQAGEGVVLLSKPFRKSDLARTVRLALDTPTEPPSILPKAA